MCEAPNNPPIRGGEFSNLFHGSAPRNADVVLVAQQSSCIGDFDFKTMLHLIESSLQDINITNNLYSVVGYGGPSDLVRPHSYTSGGRIFAEFDRVQHTMKRLHNNGTGGDIYDAMRFAAGLSWRPGVGKVMLVISCDVVTSGWFYGDAITMLRNGIVRMHYINPLQLKLKTKKRKSIIYGFDKSSVFTVKNLNSQAGDTSLRKQLRIPKVCVKPGFHPDSLLFCSGLHVNTGNRVGGLSLLSRESGEDKQGEQSGRLCFWSPFRG